jgi:UDP-3-O-[3-hydroxymyristoyl] glucosamine N-acyltransferase
VFPQGIIPREMASYRLVELAEYVQGVVRGNPDLLIDTIGGLQDVPPGGLTFAEDERHLHMALQSPAAAILTHPNLVENRRSEKSFLLHPQPRLAFAQLLALFSPFQTT